MPKTLLFVVVAVAAFALVGGSTSSCSSGTGGGSGGGSGGSTGGGSAGGSAGGAAGGMEMASADAGICTATMLMPCVTYDDRRAADAGRTVEFGTTDPGAAVPLCMQIKVGQTVTFNAGSFHPVEQDCGPVNGKLSAPDNAMTPIRFDVAGDYMYHCGFHFFPGFIKVTP